MKPFTLLKKSKQGRVGILKTPHGRVHTPYFMPIATRGAVKNLTPHDLYNLGAEMILSNTYHLFQRPGLTVLEKHGGLHSFMQWPRPILTDSGGYQVFSLAKLRKITQEGVTFQSEIDGSTISLTPESVIDAQLTIGSDIIMVLDECPPWPCTYEYAAQSLALTLQWARRSKDHFEKRIKKLKYPPSKRPLLFGIVQGGTYKKLRDIAVKKLVEIDFDGYAIGGLAVGEPRALRNKVIAWNTEVLPSDKPRYVMGLGKPEDLVDAVTRGADLFDCVIPTREARHGRVYIRNRKKSFFSKNFYQTISLKKEIHKLNNNPIDKSCSCETCATFPRSYLRHLFSINEGLAFRLATIHNLSFFLSLMKEFQKK